MHLHLLAPMILAALAGAAFSQAKPAPAVPGGVEGQVDPKTAARQKALEAAKAQPAPRVTSSRLDMSKLKTGAQPPAPRAIVVSPEDANLSPEEIRTKYKDRTGSAYVDYKTHVAPAVLAPGERGTLVMYFVLKNDAVMLAAGPKVVEFQASQGALTLGPVRVQPAGTSRIAAAFRGKTAYDDFVVAEVPVEVDAAAAEGVQALQVTFDYELYNGTTAGWIEKFRDHVRAEVRIQRPAPPATAAPTPTADPAGAARTAAVDTQAIGSAVSSAADDAAAKQGGDGAVGLDAEGSPLLWVLGASGVVLAGALLLRLRRR